jgi:hypothetical protein
MALDKFSMGSVCLNEKRLFEALEKPRGCPSLTPRLSYQKRGRYFHQNITRATRDDIVPSYRSIFHIRLLIPTKSHQDATRPPNRPGRETERWQVQHAQLAHGCHVQSRWVDAISYTHPIPEGLPRRQVADPASCAGNFPYAHPPTTTTSTSAPHQSVSRSAKPLTNPAPPLTASQPSTRNAPSATCKSTAPARASA